MHKKAIYPGTFDPITNGHLDIIKRASKLFDEVVISVAASQSKSPYFDLEKRVFMIKASIQDLGENVHVKSFNNLLVDFAKEEQASIIIRGLRAVSDFEYELQMGYANSSLDPDIETVYLMPTLEHAFVSSSIVRTLIPFKGKIDHLVPKAILPLIEGN